MMDDLEELHAFADRLNDNLMAPPPINSGRRFPAPRVLGQAVEPSTANIMPGKYARTTEYVDDLQDRFYDIKNKMFGGMAKLASETMGVGMTFDFGMTRAQVDMHVLQHMARGE